MRNSFVDTLYELMSKNRNIILITGDLGYGVLTKIWEDYPSQFINAGICEQNMTSLAVGMALEGKQVFTYSIGNFTTLRCLEQIRNDAAYHNANVKIVSVGGGFSYGYLGMSHHATEDIAITRALPNMTVLTPCDPIEASAVTRLASELHGPCYIRLGKGGEKELHNGKNLEIIPGKAIELVNGSDTAILVAGAIAEEAVTAAKNLKDDGISCAVYSFPTTKPLDELLIIELGTRHNWLFSLEEHNITGGFGGAVAEVMAENNPGARLKRIGLRDVYSSVAGDQKYLRQHYEMDRTSIVKMIKSKF